MFNKVFVLSLFICAAAAELSEGLYRNLNPEINTPGCVATAGYELGTPIEHFPSEPDNLYELVSFFLCHVFICDAYTYTCIVGGEANSPKPPQLLHHSEYWPISTTFLRDRSRKYLPCLPSDDIIIWDQDFTFRDQDQPEDAEIFVFTDTNPQPYYVTSPDNNDTYVVCTFNN